MKRELTFEAWCQKVNATILSRHVLALDQLIMREYEERQHDPTISPVAQNAVATTAD